jgi:hypothetical protein
MSHTYFPSGTIEEVYVSFKQTWPEVGAIFQTKKGVGCLFKK